MPRPCTRSSSLLAVATPLLFGSAASTHAQEQNAAQLSPQEVSYAVEDELYNDTLVSLDDVHVSTSNGVVTLTGEVSSLLAKERAAHVAGTVKGVHNVDNQLSVEPLRRRSAEELQSAVSQALLADPATEAFNITVQADASGQVTLAGRASSWAERELIERIVKGVSGVTEVNSNIGINYSSTPPDSELVAEVESMLKWDAYIDDASIGVEADDGLVTLSGTVGSAAEKSRAETIAWTAGSQGVNSETLEVATWSAEDDAARSGQRTDETAQTEQSDEQIAEAIQRVLRLDPRVASSNLEVEVEDGVATLRGMVDNLKAKRTAEQQAQAIRGVESVRDRMRVEGGENAPADEEIENQVINALAINPVTESYQISVDVARGVVDLTGHVDSWFERGVADDLASRVDGVREVDNDLAVSDVNERLAYDPYVDFWSIYEYDWYTPSQPTIWRQDSAIAAEVRDELWWSPFVNENEVGVDVENGVATLTGTVDSFAERRAATENAFEGGAAGVVNELEVENQSARLTSDQ